MEGTVYNLDPAAVHTAQGHGGPLPNSSFHGELVDRQDSGRSVSSIMQIAMQQHEEFLVARRRRQLPTLEEPPAPPSPATQSRLPDSSAQAPGFPRRMSKRFPRSLGISSNSDLNGNRNSRNDEDPPSSLPASNGSTAPLLRPPDVQRHEPDLALPATEGAAGRVARIVCDKCGEVVRVDKFAVIFQCPHCSTLSYAGSRLASPVPPAVSAQGADPSSTSVDSGVSI